MMEFDSSGVIIEQDRQGKFSASWVGLRDGKVVFKEELTNKRALAYALAVGNDGLSDMVTKFHRGHWKFADHKQLRLKIAECLPK